MSDTLIVRMLTDHSGSPDGTSCVDYEKGEDYTLRGAQAADLGRVFIREGWAVEVVPESAAEVLPEEVEEMPAADAAAEEKQALSPRTKQAPRPAGKARRRTKKR